MCTSCERSLGRRQFLGRALTAGGLAAVTGSVAGLFDPRAASAGAPPFEVDAVGEDGSFGTTDAGTNALGSLDAAAGLVQAPNTAGVSAPPIVRRSQWGADESRRANHRAYTPIRKLVVHHTASANRPSNPRAVIREMYEYHLAAGYADLGYNFVIDHHGIIYEGRYSRPYGNEQVTGEDGNGWGVVGGHAAGMNAATCGVVLIGDFTSSGPTDAALASLVWLLSWKASRHRIDAVNSDRYITRTGRTMTTENITGHRTIGQTSCPGRLAGLLPAIREQVAANAGRWPSATVNVPAVTRFEWTAAPTVPARPEPVSPGTAPSPQPAAVSGGLLPVPLAVGTIGEAVRTVQQALRRAGVTVRVDGVFGPKTRGAVTTFQTARGLAASGQVDLPTAAALGLTDANRSNVLVLPARVGARGGPVRSIQQALVRRGVPVVIDGDFGRQTRAGVYQFQQAGGLQATGEVDLATAAALGVVALNAPSAGAGAGAGAAVAAGPTPTTPGSSGAIVLPVKLGMWSDDVRRVQRALTAAGYPLAPDGRFGPITLAAVKRFQKDRGLPQTGVVHTMTAAALGLT